MKCPDAVSTLRAEILTADGPLPAAISALSTERLGLAFAAGSAPSHGLGQVVSLGFTEVGTGKTFKVSARVMSRNETVEQRHYELEFVDFRAFWRELSTDLRNQLNRRDALRVTPVSVRPIDVDLASFSEDVRERGTLVDVSVTGVAVRIHGEREGALADVQLVKMTFALPPSERSLEVWGRIRRRRVDGPARVYGIMYDPELTACFAEVESAIGRFVTDRQRQWMVKA